jgi:pilus assembly protein CpaB
MNSKSLAILGLAAGCGLIAMYGTGQLLNKPQRQVAMRDLVVAARDLKIEEVIKPDMVQVIKVPESQAPAGSFSTPSEIEGRWIQITTLKDEPVLAAKLAPKDLPPGLTSRIAKGQRAFAIEVNEQSGVSGFVMPEHRVDVLMDPKGNSGRGGRARTILQNMLVLAVGQVFTRPEDKSLLARTVTLAVTPEQAEVLTAARSQGSLSLALRGMGDTEIVERRKPEPEELETEDADKPRPVEIAVTPKAEPRKAVEPESARPQQPVHRNVIIIHGVRRTDTLKVPLATSGRGETRFAQAPPVLAGALPN